MAVPEGLNEQAKGMLAEAYSYLKNHTRVRGYSLCEYVDAEKGVSKRRKEHALRGFLYSSGILKIYLCRNTLQRKQMVTITLKQAGMKAITLKETMMFSAGRGAIAVLSAMREPHGENRSCRRMEALRYCRLAFE